MKKPSLFVLALLAAMAVGAAEDYDGSKPMICAPANGHDCTPAEKTCKRLKPEEGRDVNLYIDVAKMQVKTPYRTAELPIQNVSNNTKSLILQGTSLEFVWAATVNRTTGRLTVAIADREGAYVIFGQCKLGEASSQ
ncbi:MAG TPA: hypothetical protein PKE27_13075 [Povalibacter sp.]|uniref:hypothetical protein n=1 Tax=Povalibacter sp. TaxID=1962978 RepID=UPI002D1BDC07|nr:hypothetical protein [Povalibacter sp.]HMN45509.1 hypothetical protein [Povalibacter sp.]